MLISDDYVSLYTTNRQAFQILHILKKHCSKNYTIVDATAGMGGNSIYFCKYFDYVYCIDSSRNTVIYLEHNLKQFDNKFIINDNCLDILKIIKYDIIFFDPPWGGSDYKYKKAVNLYLNYIDINDIIESLYYYKNIKIIALKAPINFYINCNTKWTIQAYNIYKNDSKTILFKLLIYKKA